MNVINEKLEHFRQWLWSDSPRAQPWFGRLIKNIIRTVVAVLRDFRSGQLSMRAMSLVYTTVIAVVPLLALSFSVLKGFGMHNNLEPALLEALVDLGDKRFDIVSSVMGFIDNVNVGVLGSVGFAILIYSVISMMHKIEHAFNYTWRIKRARGMSERFRDYLSVIFVAPLLIFLSAAITASSQTDQAIAQIQAMPFGAGLVQFSSKLIPYLIMSVGFSFIYMFLPNTQVKLLPAFIGGLVTAIIWKVMGWSISVFIANSASNVAIYSAFASIIILMVWMYLGWLVLLVGASVAFYQQNPKMMLSEKQEEALSNDLRLKISLNIIYSVFEKYMQGAKPWTSQALAEKFSLNVTLIEDLADELEMQGYIVRRDSEQRELYPGRSADAVSVANLLLDLNRGAKSDLQRAVSYDIQVDELALAADLAVKQHFGNQTLEQLIKKQQSST